MRSAAQRQIWVPHLEATPAPKTYTHAAAAVVTNRSPVTVTMPNLTRDMVLRAKDGLIRLDETLPHAESKLWEVHVPRDPAFDEPDDGLIRKDGKDKKCFFHYRPDLEHHLRAKGVRIDSWHQAWFSDCGAILESCVNAALGVAERMDGMRPGFNFRQRIASQSGHVLRILKYDPRAGIVAAKHIDRCALTFHLAESADGLYVEDRFGTLLHRTPLSPDATLFTGRQIELVTKNAITALPHYVRDSTHGMGTRWAMVCFIKMDLGTV